VSAVVLDIDSPGGTVAGVTELAAEIRAARGGSKPIVAAANTLAASAAYWLASQADEVVVSPSGSVGSIGVYAVHQEVSRMLDEMGVGTTIISAGPHKTEGNEFEPLTDEARADIQSRVDVSYASFVADVAAGRGVTAEQVEADFGGGRVLTARKAQSAGMVDRVETLAQTVARLGTAGGRRRALAADVTGPELVAGEEPDDHDTDPLSLLPPFTERVAALADDAAEIAGHAQERARLRAKEGRAAFSATTETALRTTRDALSALLEPVDPVPGDAASGAVHPPAAAVPVTPPVAAPIPSRFRSRADWLRYLETRPH
jgi:signal peptide peptidase SppA